MRSVPLTPTRLRAYDSVVVATAHKDLPYRQILQHAKAVVDTRNAYRGRQSSKITRL